MNTAFQPAAALGHKITVQRGCINIVRVWGDTAVPVPFREAIRIFVFKLKSPTTVKAVHGRVSDNRYRGSISTRFCHVLWRVLFFILNVLPAFAQLLCMFFTQFRWKLKPNTSANERSSQSQWVVNNVLFSIGEKANAYTSKEIARKIEIKVH